MHPSAPGGSAAASPIANPAWRAVVEAAIARLCELPGALLPILHEIQGQLGYVPPDAVPLLAGALNLSAAEVHGVITFYHDFRSAPPGRHVLKVCRAEACQAMGSQQLEQRLQARLGTAHGTAADRSVTVEPVYCLGNCALAPSVQLDGKVIGRVGERRLDQILDGCRDGAAGVGTAGGRA